MNYRGEDLDLRTPQTWTRSPADYPDTSALNGPRRYASRSEPIWVDETVLACCNLAYDLAVTHRAGEVRLEHLIYALTRIDTASEALETRGVRVASLRRDMGSVVASEIPVAFPNGKGSPRRAEELETVLRDASDIGQRRGQPANIDDLITVLTETPRDLAGLGHVRRYLGARADRVDYEPVRPREPRYTPPPQPVYEPRRDYEPAAAPQVRTDALQNSRIEALEQAVRGLGSDLSSERKVVANLLQDIQRDVGVRRDDSPMIDRLGSVEQAIERRLSEVSRSWNLMNDRLQMIEAAVHKSRGGDHGVELVALHDRITGLERAIQAIPGSGGIDPRQWAQITERLKSFEAALARPAGGVGGLGERLDAIETILLERASEASQESAKLAERIKAIEDGQAAQKVQALQLNAGLAAEVNKLSTAVAQTPGGERTLPMLNERFQAFGAMLERQRAELASSIVQPLGERLNAIGSALEARQVESGRAIATLGERVAAIERSMTGYVQKIADQAPGYEEDLVQMQDQLVKLTNSQISMSSAMEQWRQPISEINALGNRLAVIERMTTRPAQMMEELSGKVDALYKLTAEKIERRNKFYYWLFGTDSWVKASWPDRKRLTPPPAPRPPVQPAR